MEQPSARASAEFASPPVSEVALSVAFLPLAGLDLAELVEVWQTHFRGDFPHLEEHAPFQMPIEPLGGPALGPAVSFQIASVPPSARLWLVDDARNHLIQLQRDFLAYNWRRVEEPAEYPRFSLMQKRFGDTLDVLTDHIRSRTLGEFQPTQAEITYINHVGLSDQRRHVPLHEVLSILKNTSVDGLGVAEGERLALDYPLAVDGEQVGRLHIAGEPALRRHDKKPVVALTITARGLPLQPSREGVLDFLKLGSDAAFQAFLALTTDARQQEWGIR